MLHAASQPPLHLSVLSPTGSTKSTPAQSDPKTLQPLIEKLIVLASMLKELQTQAHLIHLNYEGSNFLEVHGFLKDQYEVHVEQFDAVAEFVRSLDHFMPMCACGLKDVMPKFVNATSYDGREQLLAYYQNIEAMGYLAKEVEGAAQASGAPDVANYMADLVGHAFKTSWFLKATMRCG